MPSRLLCSTSQLELLPRRLLSLTQSLTSEPGRIPFSVLKIVSSRRSIQGRAIIKYKDDLALNTFNFKCEHPKIYSSSVAKEMIHVALVTGKTWISLESKYLCGARSIVHPSKISKGARCIWKMAGFCRSSRRLYVYGMSEINIKVKQILH